MFLPISIIVYYKRLAKRKERRSDGGSLPIFIPIFFRLNLNTNFCTVNPSKQALKASDCTCMNTCMVCTHADIHTCTHTQSKSAFFLLFNM